MIKFYIALTLSLVFHLSQYGLISYWSDGWTKSKISQNEITEIDFISEPKNDEEKTKQIVKTKENLQKEDIKTQAQFNAEKTNRTKIQTRAQENGQFRNNENKINKNSEQKNSNEGDFFKPQYRPQFSQSPQLPSRSEYQLPQDIQIGNATNLNTDADIYASFYNRVTDLFYIRWIQRLDYIWSRTPEESKKMLSGKNWTTDVEILLNADGRYLKGLIMKKSGYSEFDSAAIFGFANAGFFPNPPKGKVDADGYIRLKYRINVGIR